MSSNIDETTVYRKYKVDAYLFCEVCCFISNQNTCVIILLFRRWWFKTERNGRCVILYRYTCIYLYGFFYLYFLLLLLIYLFIHSFIRSSIHPFVIFSALFLFNEYCLNINKNESKICTTIIL